jgi:hypothetical protein
LLSLTISEIAWIFFKITPVFVTQLLQTAFLSIIKPTVFERRETFMRILLWIIITVLLVEIPSFAGSSPGDSIRIPITTPDHGELRLSATDYIRKLKIYDMYVSSVEFNVADSGKVFSFERGKLVVSQGITDNDRKLIFDSIGKLKAYGMYVSSVEFVSKNDTGKIFSFERGKLLISQEINKDDREFIFDTIGKLKNHHIHVSSLKYVYGIKENGYQYLDKGDASKDKLGFEKGNLKILFLKTTEGKRIEAERERDEILKWLEELNDRGLFVSSFSCLEKATLRFEDGHLTLPFAYMCK